MPSGEIWRETGQDLGRQSGLQIAAPACRSALFVLLGITCTASHAKHAAASHDKHAELVLYTPSILLLLLNTLSMRTSAVCTR
jgi:hypothetical protein